MLGLCALILFLDNIAFAQGIDEKSFFGFDDKQVEMQRSASTEVQGIDNDVHMARM